MQELQSALNTADFSGRGRESVSVTFALSPSGNDFVPFSSTIEREVAFASHHALHHMAMIKIAAKETLGKEVDEGFGVAPGTKRFLEKQKMEGGAQKRGMSTRAGASSKEMSTKSDGNVPALTYFSAWFCPFAHRCTLALEHHQGFLDYEWKESLGWEKRDNDDGEVENGKDWFYHWKSEELLECNPAGMVPTLKDDRGRVVSESIVTIEYVDNLVRGGGGRKEAELLVPRDDPVEEARGRVWADKVAREMCSPYYKILVRQEEEEQREGLKELLEGMERFSKELRKTDGRLFMGGERIGVVDMTLFPWAWRFYVFEHYRGEEFAIKRGGKAVEGWDVEPFFDWLDAMMER
jgi:glutathione S-transferase